VVGDLIVAHNPDPDSRLPYLVRIPLGPAGVVVKAKEPWPRTNKVFCHRAPEWPDDAEIVERHAVRSCSRRSPAIDLVLARARENRSQLVITRARGREVIFWQSPRTTKQARPGVHLPTARAHGQVLEILVDTGEKYPYAFGSQQATTQRQWLAAGDYAVASTGTSSPRSSARRSRTSPAACCRASSPTRWPTFRRCHAQPSSSKTATAACSSCRTPPGAG
jgi:hypothetical protein